MNEIEILAPAGAREQLEAAVRCGADAVYFGTGALNARRNAANFEGDALREAVEYCHTRGVKVHLTLNTVVLERELPEAAAIIETVCALGVDAVIVQDLGVVRLLRAMAPGLRLHASTQMAVHNLSGAKQLEQLGFSRVVLAREMSAQEIREVAANTSLETEIFVHGALCICVSGQCYMSSVIGERSGNRGLCAQPCRLPFSIDGKGRCGLSLKDLSLVEQLAEVRALGVSSIKIEGRMKRPEYVAAAVTACRDALAGRKADIDRLQAVFSRSGFTDGYYKSHLGADMFGTRQREDVFSADGVIKELGQLYRAETPRVPLTARLTLGAGLPALLELKDPEGNAARAEGERPQEALSKPTTPEMAEQSLRKLGGTPYFLKRVEADCGTGLMLPVSQLNLLRRDAIGQITALRAATKSIPCESWRPEEKTMKLCKGTPALRGRFALLEQIPEESTALERIILPAAEAAKASEPALLDKLVVELPRISFDDYRTILPLLDALKAKGVTRAAAGNIGAVYAAWQMGFDVIGDWALNLTNSSALVQCAELGCMEATASWELNLNDVKRLGAGLPCGMIGYGRLPLMIMRNCPARQEIDCARCGGVATMYDRKGTAFPVGCGGTKACAEVYNSVPLWLADRMRELEGIPFLTLYFTGESRAECAGVIRGYQAGEKREGITRGLYYRNIL